MVNRREFTVPSSDGVHQVHAVLWAPGEGPKAVVQLVHGICEYALRYDPFARFLAENGFAVVGHDHLGHGNSVNDPSELGYVGKDGAVLWLKDMELVRKMGASYAPKAPYIILGHSMGSFLVRRYLIYYGKRVDGAVIMGTGHQPCRQ